MSAPVLPTTPNGQLDTTPSSSAELEHLLDTAETADVLEALEDEDRDEVDVSGENELSFDGEETTNQGLAFFRALLSDEMKEVGDNAGASTTQKVGKGKEREGSGRKIYKGKIQDVAF